MKRLRICVVTGSRADFGLLVSPMRAIAADNGLELRLVATGMHLAPEFGRTIDAIRSEGFVVDEEVETQLASDSARGVAKSVGLGVIGFADAFARVAPDVVLVLGDRFEILAAAQAAMLMRIPIAHLCGGDVTEGSVDESIRHAISKMAHLHFATNQDAARRLARMGESPDRIVVCGSPGIDALLDAELLSRSDFEASTGLRLSTRNLLVTFHPVTVAPGRTETELEELIAALAALPEDVALIVTGANADAEGRAVNARLDTFVAERPGARLVASLGMRNYASALALVDAVVGNSSSGLYEAPTIGVSTVDVGERQTGRLRASSVIHVPAEREAIGKAIVAAMARPRSAVANPYGDGHAGLRIAQVLASITDAQPLLNKPFHDGIDGGSHDGE